MIERKFGSDLLFFSLVWPVVNLLCYWQELIVYRAVYGTLGLALPHSLFSKSYKVYSLFKLPDFRGLELSLQNLLSFNWCEIDPIWLLPVAVDPWLCSIVIRVLFKSPVIVGRPYFYNILFIRRSFSLSSETRSSHEKISSLSRLSSSFSFWFKNYSFCAIYFSRSTSEASFYLSFSSNALICAVSF